MLHYIIIFSIQSVLLNLIIKFYYHTISLITNKQIRELLMRRFFTPFSRSANQSLGTRTVLKIEIDRSVRHETPKSFKVRKAKMQFNKYPHLSKPLQIRRTRSITDTEIIFYYER